MDSQVEKFEQWAVVELFGHHKIAGFVTEAVIAGGPMLRVDVPEVAEEKPAHTKFYGNAAIYAIHPCTESLARQAAASIREWDSPLPVHVPDLSNAERIIRDADRARDQQRALPRATVLAVNLDPDDDDELAE